MAGIAGIARAGKSWLVNVMLDRMHHRGSYGRKVVETPRWTMGVIWPELQAEAGAFLERHHIAMDERIAASSPWFPQISFLKGIHWEWRPYITARQPMAHSALPPR